MSTYTGWTWGCCVWCSSAAHVPTFNNMLYALYKLIIGLLPPEPSCKPYVMSATSSLATKPPIVTGKVH